MVEVRKIAGESQQSKLGRTTRDRVIAAIYETVIRPDLYDEFISAWSEHIDAALTRQNVSSTVPDRIDFDPELTAHFARAHSILEQLGRPSVQLDLLKQVRSAGCFVMICNARKQVLSASKTASAFAVEGAGLDLFRQVMAPHSAKVLDELLDALGRDDASSLAAVVLSTGTTPRHLLARPVTLDHSDGATEHCIMIEALEYQWGSDAEAMLIKSFGLSPAELDIVRNLLAGRSLQEIADKSGRSRHTVRNQMKSILAKTGAPGQVDLIRLVVFLINQNDRNRAAPGDQSLPYDIMTMSSGLKMQVFRAGPSDGTPVLFLHGMLDGMAPVRFLQPELMRRGLRMIAPVRPGFGKSDGLRKNDNVIDILSAHLDDLIDRLDLKAPLILGHMSGGPYAQVLAARLRDRISGAVIVSGGVPITRIGQLSVMPHRQRVVATTARFAPALLPLVVRAGISQIDSADINGFLTGLYQPGTREHDAIERLNLTELVHAAYRFSVQQGAAGFSTDCHFLMRDWTNELGAPNAPVIYLHSEFDPIVPYNDILSVMGSRKDVEVRILRDTGQMVLYEHPDQVFDAVNTLLARR